MTRRAKAIIGGVVAAVAGAAAYFVAEGASVPVSMAAQTDSSFDAQWEKVGTFEKEWQGDGSLLVVAWVGHTGGDSPDVSTARASWRGSSLRLSYSTNSPELRRMSMAIYKLSFRVTSLPKQEYQVSWGDWFSSRVAETRRGK